MKNFNKKKFIPLNEFINISLYSKESGYYIKKNPLGKSGDFITAQLISSLFSEMIAIWSVAYWNYLKKPKKILFVELGSGDGSLCETIIKTSKKFGSFYNSLEIYLLEISNKLKKIQKNKISDKKVKWIKNLDEIKHGPVIFFGNEFFDSLAIKQFYKKKNYFFEKYISLHKNNKSFDFCFKKAKKKQLKKLQSLRLLSSGDIIEYPIDALKYLEKIMKKIKKHNGALLIFDYGYNQKIIVDTIQSVKKHQYINPFLKIGKSDITSLVNFKLFTSILKKNNFNVKKITTQSEFLQKMGINERANIVSKKMNFNQKAQLYSRLERLLSNRQMGSLFKVLVAQKKGSNFSMGF